MDLSKLTTLSYYFDLSPEASSLSILIAIYFLSLFVLRAHIRLLIGKHSERKTVRKLQRKHLKRLAVIGTLGILTIGARQADIIFFGMRAVAYLLILLSFYEMWAIKKNFGTKVHNIVAEKNNRKEADKYIPKPKKRNKKSKRR